MNRQAPLLLAAVLVFGAAGALAQGGDLSRVTMRVLDDVGDVDAVVLALDASGGDGEEAAGRTGRDAAGGESREPAAAGADDARRELRRERDELNDVDHDERSEGRLEDRDVERPAVPPTDAP